MFLNFKVVKNLAKPIFFVCKICEFAFKITQNDLQECRIN